MIITVVIRLRERDSGHARLWVGHEWRTNQGIAAAVALASQVTRSISFKAHHHRPAPDRQIPEIGCVAEKLRERSAGQDHGGGLFSSAMTIPNAVIGGPSKSVHIIGSPA